VRPSEAIRHMVELANVVGLLASQPCETIFRESIIYTYLQMTSVHCNDESQLCR
jgi:hypothetical protein